MNKAGMRCYKIICENLLSLSIVPQDCDSMCQYFWWTCESCSATQDYALICQPSNSHMTCKQSQQATPLPLIIPAPFCQLCGVQRRAERHIDGLPIQARYTKSCVGLDPGLKAILNDATFWIKPSLRLANFKQTIEKYNDARTKALEQFHQEKQEDKKHEVRTVEQQIQVDQLKAAWQSLREGVTAWPKMKSDPQG